MNYCKYQKIDKYFEDVCENPVDFFEYSLYIVVWHGVKIPKTFVISILSIVVTVSKNDLNNRCCRSLIARNDGL